MTLSHESQGFPGTVSTMHEERRGKARSNVDVHGGRRKRSRQHSWGWEVATERWTIEVNCVGKLIRAKRVSWNFSESVQSQLSHSLEFIRSELKLESTRKVPEFYRWRAQRRKEFKDLPKLRASNRKRNFERNSTHPRNHSTSCYLCSWYKTTLTSHHHVAPRLYDKPATKSTKITVTPSFSIQHSQSCSNRPILPMIN